MKLLNIKDDNLIKKTGNSVKLTINKETKSYPVYKVNLDLLYYNEYNDRIATWIDNYEANPENEPFEGMDEIKRNKIIEQFIVDSDPRRIMTTKNNIALVSQKVPGVVLNDGRVIDGNRRFTCLRKLREEHPEKEEYNYFETAILDLDIKDDKRTIKILELNLQHATDEKADYDLIDFAIGTYRVIRVEKLLDVPEYAINTNEAPAKVRERLELAELINEYLEFIKLPGQYAYLREKQAYSLFQEMLTPLHKCKNEEEAAKLKRMIFTNYMAGSFTDVKKYCREISTIMGSEYYDNLLKTQEETIRSIEKTKDKAQISDSGDLEKFVKKMNPEKDTLKSTTDNAVSSYRVSKVKSGPSDVVSSCTSSLREIDTRLFASLSKEELLLLDKNLKSLEKTLQRINKELEDAKEKDPDDDSDDSGSSSSSGNGETENDDKAENIIMNPPGYPVPEVLLKEKLEEDEVLETADNSLGMKIIFSRKGFDWANGGTPSPVMPDGTMLSMPIPSGDDEPLFALYYKDRAYSEIMNELKPSGDFSLMNIHHDPDIRKDCRKELPEGWVPAFGQIDQAESHLENQGVKVGDLFLFFGWFGMTQEKNGHLKYISKEKDKHMIWGYMQIGKISRGKECLNYPWHPHCYDYGNNTIYEASEKLIINGVDTGLPGAGCLKYSKDVVLTKDDETRSRWLLPDFFKEVNISCHKKEDFKPEGYFQTVKIGQEFVVSSDDRVTEWAKSIIVNNFDENAGTTNPLAETISGAESEEEIRDLLGPSKEEYYRQEDEAVDKSINSIIHSAEKKPVRNWNEYHKLEEELIRKLQNESNGIEILNKECRKHEGVFTDNLAVCITYREQGEVKYLINDCMIDDDLLPGYSITSDSSLYDMVSEDVENLSENETDVMVRKINKAKRPDSAAEEDLARLSILIIKEKCLELKMKTEESLSEGTELW